MVLQAGKDLAYAQLVEQTCDQEWHSQAVQAFVRESCDQHHRVSCLLLLRLQDFGIRVSN